MSGWEFEGKNSIVSFAVSLELSAVIAPAVVQHIANNHQVFRPDLPRKQEQPMFMLPLPGQTFPQPMQIAGVVFDYVNSDGTVARALTVAGNQITYMTAAYPRWKEFLPVLERVFADLLGLFPALPPIANVSLTVSNRFNWTGDRAEASLGTLLRTESKLFAPHIIETSEHCHSFHGYIETCSAPLPGRCIRNVNVQTVDASNGTKSVVITLSHRLLLDQQIHDSTPLFAVSEPPSTTGALITTKLHDDNNVIFRDVVNSVLTAKMPGLST